MLGIIYMVTFCVAKRFLVLNLLISFLFIFFNCILTRFFVSPVFVVYIFCFFSMSFFACNHISLSLRTGWRTMLVVPELEREVGLLWELRDNRKVFLKKN